jgi:hypothetical protein
MTTLTHDTTIALWPLPALGSRLANGATVIATRHAANGDPYILCHIEGREYASWCMNPYEGFTVMGHYFQIPQFGEAVADFLNRG